MIKFKNQLSKKEELEIGFSITEISDIYGEFFITRKNLRLYLKENTSLLFEILKKGDYIAYDTEGIAIVTGFAEKTITVFDIREKKEKIINTRKYIKFLTNNNKIAEGLLCVILWHLGDKDLYCKIRNNNPIKEILLRKGFSFRGGRGKEVLLCREGKRIKKLGVEKEN